MIKPMKIWHKAFILIGALLVLFSSCKKDDNNNGQQNIPVLTSAWVATITKTTAISGGNVTDDGGAMVTARGVCWSTSENPTISDSKTLDGAGIGDFTSSLSGLESNTTYYLRAYATSGNGTGYGDQRSFTTYKDDAITDIDGNYYNIVTIGNQQWLAENLRTTRYNDGNIIPTGHTYEEWENLTTDAYAIQPHIDIDGLDTEAEVLQAYGALYNWYTVETGKLCPTGWHVPTYVEWTTLIDFVGGESIAGGKLKSTRTDPDAHPRWLGSNAGATDEYGFSALPGGNRSIYGVFSLAGVQGDWWSSTEITEYTSVYVWYLRLSWGYEDIFKYYFQKESGNSIRCLKDN